MRLLAFLVVLLSILTITHAIGSNVTLLNSTSVVSQMNCNQTLHYLFISPNLCKWGEDCPESNRFVVISAESQGFILDLKVTATYNHTQQSYSDSGISTGVVVFLGEWISLSGQGGCDGSCFDTDCVWIPFNSLNVHVTVTSVDPACQTPFDIVVSAFPRNSSAPIPGGCCITCAYPADPTLHLSYSKGELTVSFQQANMGTAFKLNGICNCDAISADNVGATLKYQVYQAFVPQCGSYYQHNFDSVNIMNVISKMSTVSGVKQYGLPLNHNAIPPNFPLLVSAVSSPGQGVVYNVLVTDVTNSNLNPDIPIENFQSIYSPVSSYGCTFDGTDDLPTCTTSTIDGNISFLVGCGILSLIGIFLGIAGHRYFAWQLAILGFLSSSFCIYIIFAALSSISTTGGSIASILIGLTCGFLFWLLWYLFNLISVPYLIISGTFGFFVACVIIATPFGGLSFLSNNFNFGMIFACLCLLTPMPLTCFGRTLSIVASSVVGGYLTLLPVAFFMNADFIALVYNLIRRASFSLFATNYSGSYFGNEFNGCVDQTSNIAMASAWLFLAIVFSLLQFLKTAPTETIPSSPLYRNGQSRKQVVQNAVKSIKSKVSNMTSTSSTTSSTTAATPNHSRPSQQQQQRQRQQQRQQHQRQELLQERSTQREPNELDKLLPAPGTTTMLTPWICPEGQEYDGDDLEEINDMDRYIVNNINNTSQDFGQLQ